MRTVPRVGMTCSIIGISVLLGIVPRAHAGHDDGDDQKVHRQVIVPEEDRFSPFALTIHRGETVEWVNQDTDDHTVVSDDELNTTGPEGFNQLLPGTDSNHGQPGVLQIRFRHTGTFIYYCRFHSHLGADQQPVAPGPDGGIQDANGNFGTPMMGVITVLK